MGWPCGLRRGVEIRTVAVSAVALGAVWWSWSPAESPLQRAIVDAGTVATSVDLIAASGVRAESLMILCPYERTDDAAATADGVDGVEADTSRDTYSSLVLLDSDVVAEVVRLRVHQVDGCTGTQEGVAPPEFATTRRSSPWSPATATGRPGVSTPPDAGTDGSRDRPLGGSCVAAYPGLVRPRRGRSSFRAHLHPQPAPRQ